MMTVMLAGVGVADGDDMLTRASAVSLAAAGPLDRAGCFAAPAAGLDVGAVLKRDKVLLGAYGRPLGSAGKQVPAGYYAHAKAPGEVTTADEWLAQAAAQHNAPQPKTQ